jgi:hypothetical protein
MSLGELAEMISKHIINIFPIIMPCWPVKDVMEHFFLFRDTSNHCSFYEYSIRILFIHYVAYRQAKMISLNITATKGVNKLITFSQVTGPPDEGFTQFTSVSPGECQESTFKMGHECLLPNTILPFKSISTSNLTL